MSTAKCMRAKMWNGRAEPFGEIIFWFAGRRKCKTAPQAMPAEEALFYAARRAKDAPRILQHYFEPPRKNTACAETPANGRGAPLKKQPAQPWRCLWLLFLEQITITLPFLLIILHLSHIGFTEGLTFISISFRSRKIFLLRKNLFPWYFFVVKRLNGETKFRLTVFRRYFIWIFLFRLSFWAEWADSERSRKIFILRFLRAFPSVT